jgi:hypothetical protein
MRFSKEDPLPGAQRAVDSKEHPFKGKNLNPQTLATRALFFGDFISKTGGCL